MSFAQEYLELMTECHQALKNASSKYGPTVNFFGRTTKYTDEQAPWIIQAAVEEWESTMVITLKHPDTEDVYDFNLYEVIYCGASLNDQFDPDLFIADLFRYELQEDFFENGDSFKDPVVIKDYEGLRRLFSVATQDDLANFATCYATAVDAKIINTYRSKYSTLQLKYPNLPYYPSFDFSYDETDYYESSTC